MLRRTAKTRIICILTAVVLVVGLQGIAALVPPKAVAQQAPFLLTPYYGSRAISAYFDHDGDGNPNDRIEIYTGQTAERNNGACGWIGGVPRAYFTQPGAGGICLWYDGHKGTDFNLSYEQVLSAAGGQVLFAGWYNTNDPNGRNMGYGLYVQIPHPNGYETLYGHLSAVTVVPNEYVNAGQIIGNSGCTGVCTGPHLHFEVRDTADVRVDPFNPNLWKLGQWVGAPLSAPAQTTSITIDDGDAGFSKGYVGYFTDWTYATDAGFNGDTYHSATTDVAYAYRWAKWQPTLSTSTRGMYEIYVHVPPNHRTTWWAPYTVTHTYGSTTAHVDQLGLSNQWVSIGKYFLSPGYASVEVRNQTETWDIERYVAADAVRFVRLSPTYLPDVRARNGWESVITIRSNGGDTFLRVNYLDSNGNDVCTTYYPHHPPAGGALPISPLCDSSVHSAIRSAVVYAGEDVAVVVENATTNKGYDYNGIPANDPLNASWGQVGADLRLPLVMNNHNNWNSETTMLNTGTQTAYVQFTYYDANGNAYEGFPYHPDGYPLAPNVSFTYQQNGTNCPTVGAARITAAQPLAVLVSHWKDTTSNHMVYAHTAFTRGDTTNHLPLVYRRYSPSDSTGWCTGIDVINLGSSGANVTLTYRPTNMPGVFTSVQWVAAGGKASFWLPSLAGFPDGSYGVATLTAGQDIASVVNTIKYAADVAVSYNAALGDDGSAVVILPAVYRASNGKDTGVQVHNVGSQSVNMTITYYTTGGAVQCSNGPYAVSSGEGHNFYQPTSCLPGGFAGSAVVTATGGDGRIVAQVNVMKYGAGYAGSYSGVNR